MIPFLITFINYAKFMIHVPLLVYQQGDTLTYGNVAWLSQTVASSKVEMKEVWSTCLQQPTHESVSSPGYETTD